MSGKGQTECANVLSEQGSKLVWKDPAVGNEFGEVRDKPWSQERGRAPFLEPH